METYFDTCKKKNANENSCVKRTNQNILKMVSNCAVCGRKMLMFLKNQ